jgi:carboxyl-terminal processing protease
MDCALAAKILFSSFQLPPSTNSYWRGLRHTTFLCVVVLTLMFAALPATASPPADKGQLSSLDRATIELMAKDASEAVKKNYFDPTFGGLDFNAAYASAQQAIANAGSVHEGYDAIADMLAKLNDSHTIFVPPEQPFTVEQGWDMQLIGDKCFVTYVKHGSDAEAQGLKPGDEITELENVRPTRTNWDDLTYRIKMLTPRSSLHLVVSSPGGTPGLKTIASVVKKRAGSFDLTGNQLWIYIHQYDSDMEKYDSHVVTTQDVVVFRMRSFNLKEEAVAGQIHKAEKSKALILDLRGNGGGSEDLMLSMLSEVFDRTITVGETIGRSKPKTITAKGGSHAYSGKLIVLVDSDSASASEVFARVVQLEKRGPVIGDQTAGAVRRAIMKDFVHGQGQQYAYGAEITVTDLKMTDGKSLEKVGVTPDEILLPTAQQLAAGEDPQLARAFELAGVKLSPKQVGTLFPRSEK